MTETTGSNQRLGRYELLELLGVGGMAEVYRARPSSGAPVPCVVKRLRASRDEPRIRDMLIKEGHLGLRVRHPNLVSGWGVETTEDGEPFLVQELVVGADLRQLLDLLSQKGLTMPVWLALHVVAETLGGLDYLHRLDFAEFGAGQGLVHCDVTPENILVSNDGRVKLTDLGVATSAAQVANEPAKGKITYMSPEQLSREPIDGRSDVFSAAVVLWESITGQQLFTGVTGPEVMAQVCAGQRVPPSRFCAEEVPPAVDALVLRGLSIDVSARPPSAADFRQSLLDVVSTYFGSVQPLRVQEEVLYLLRAGSRPDEKVRIAIESPVEIGHSAGASDVHRTAPRLRPAKRGVAPKPKSPEDFWDAATPVESEVDDLLRTYLDES